MEINLLWPMWPSWQAVTGSRWAWTQVLLIFLKLLEHPSLLVDMTKYKGNLISFSHSSNLPGSDFLAFFVDCICSPPTKGRLLCTLKLLLNSLIINHSNLTKSGKSLQLWHDMTQIPVCEYRSVISPCRGVGVQKGYSVLQLPNFQVLLTGKWYFQWLGGPTCPKSVPSLLRASHYY